MNLSSTCKRNFKGGTCGTQKDNSDWWKGGWEVQFLLYLMNAISKDGRWKIHPTWETINTEEHESKRIRKNISLRTRFKEVDISSIISIIMESYGKMLYN